MKTVVMSNEEWIRRCYARMNEILARIDSSKETAEIVEYCALIGAAARVMAASVGINPDDEEKIQALGMHIFSFVESLVPLLAGRPREAPGARPKKRPKATPERGK